MVAEGGENSDMSVTCHHVNKPNRPKLIVKQSLPKYTWSFQMQHYQKCPWLYVIPAVEGLLFYYCSKSLMSEKSPLATNADLAFISSEFKSWKKAFSDLLCMKDLTLIRQP